MGLKSEPSQLTNCVPKLGANLAASHTLLLQFHLQPTFAQYLSVGSEHTHQSQPFVFNNCANSHRFYHLVFASIRFTL